MAKFGKIDWCNFDIDQHPTGADAGSSRRTAGQWTGPTVVPWFLSHFRDKDQVEVDFVLESPLREVMGIEVKAAASVNSGDFKGLRKLRELAGQPFVTGIVLYDGTQALSFGDGLWAVPLGRL